jgi:hypothetical protein
MCAALTPIPPHHEAELEHGNGVRHELKRSATAVEMLIEVLADECRAIWHFEGGEGCTFKRLLKDALARRGLRWKIAKDRHPGAKALQAKRWMREQVIARDGLTCQYCRRELHPREATLDHRVARSKGGPDSLDNLCIACGRCNGRKADF